MKVNSLALVTAIGTVVLLLSTVLKTNLVPFFLIYTAIKAIKEIRQTGERGLWMAYVSLVLTAMMVLLASIIVWSVV